MVADSNDTEQQPAPAASARRVLDLLCSFSRTRHTLSSRELSTLTGIALPSVYRYVSLLRDTGLLVGDDRGNYHLSVRVLGLAAAAEAADSLIELADPVMRDLAAETGETVLLVRLVAQASVCVHRIESSHPLRTSYEPGQPLPLEHGASARLLLGSMKPTARQAVLRSVADRDPDAADRLRADVALAQERGWATSEEEIDRGIWAAAAAVRDASGHVIAAISVPSPLVRAPVEAQERLLTQVRAAAAQLSALLP